ncbi:MAG: YbhB/YbcL family Raf kinase inhibitor-like protein [Chloroflexota bacterium]|nr:YbhB/YbcL family Raf kinase inhibitor-like protein [Chloroflexota bacterium]
MALTLESKSFKEGELIPVKHHMSEAYGMGCTGGNVAPELHWKGVPEGTKSIVIQCFDPDAPTGSGFWHWVVANIPANTTFIPEGGRAPEGSLETRTDIGAPGWIGPCPPEGHGVHRYIFTISCLGVGSIPVDVDSSAAVVGFMTNMNAIEQAKLTGVVAR